MMAGVARSRVSLRRPSGPPPSKFMHATNALEIAP